MAEGKAKTKQSSTKGPKAPAAKSSGKSGKRSTQTEVERRWNEYWRCRKQLEEAVAEVAAAQESLAVAMELERSRRAVFEETKRSLEQLLEVEPPSPPGAPQKRLDLVSGEDD